MFRLKTMGEAAYGAWRAASEAGYAEDKVRVGIWQPDEAAERSRKEFDALLPQGLATPGHELRSMVSEAGERVGHAWFTIENREVGRVVFIYDIGVDEDHRRHGYGRLALAEIEAFAREQGCLGVMLHVFGDNEGALQLYRSAGYLETNVMMLKRVEG